MVGASRKRQRLALRPDYITPGAGNRFCCDFLAVRRIQNHFEIRRRGPHIQIDLGDGGVHQERHFGLRLIGCQRRNLYLHRQQRIAHKGLLCLEIGQDTAGARDQAAWTFQWECRELYDDLGNVLGPGNQK